MKLVFDQKFVKEVKKLPSNQQSKLVKLLDILVENPFDSRLHTKQLSPPLQGLFSFRINREYRTLFRFLDADSIFLTHVKHRKDIYR
jgi:mRNA-degrading endonuclease RelE of RelBE toxin-antitoxin system